MDVIQSKSLDEDSFQSAAVQAWSLAIRDFYNPPLPEPQIENIPDVSSYFYIDSATWTVHLNVSGVPLHLNTQEVIPYLTSICHHEIQHYLLCPYDGVMNGRMYTAARKHVNDATAMFVSNFFADLVVDSNLLRRFPSLTHRRIALSIHDSAMRIQDHSELWKLIVTCYRVMWGFPIPPTVDVEQHTFEVAKEIVQIARGTIGLEHRWPSSCEKIAQILSNWIPNDESLIGSSSQASIDVEQEWMDGSKRIIAVPIDVDGIMGSPLEARNGDLARKCLDRSNSPNLEEEMERLAIEVEHLGGDIEDLQGIFLIAGIGSERAEWTRFWYRAKAYNTIRFEVKTSKTIGSIPLAPEVWRLGDPLEELDIIQSLQAFPILIPNRSTRKWQHYETAGLESSKLFPDMLIVIDSSGSMTWAMKSHTVSGDYHTALVASFAAIDFAFQRGCKVAAINFSDGVQTSDWSRERSSVERILLEYQGGGTIAPVKKIIELCDKADKAVMVLIITDAEISNWKQLTGTVESLSRRDHKLFLFHIGASTGSRASRIHQAMTNAGASIYPIKSAKDLPRLVIEQVRNTYR
jgi:Mg-chelatase subunit ChlD